MQPNTIIGSVLILIVISLSNVAAHRNNTPTVTWSHNKDVCLKTVYNANITLINFRWTLFRFQWYFETVRKFSPVLDLSRSFDLATEESLNTTVEIRISLSEDELKLQLQLLSTPKHPANYSNATSSPENKGISEEHYDAELTIGTRNGNITKRALGRKKIAKAAQGAIIFSWSLLQKERLRAGKLMEIYTRILGSDQRGRHAIQTLATNLLPNPNDQNLVFMFSVKRIRFDADDQMMVA